MKAAPPKRDRKPKKQAQLRISREVKKAISRFIRSTEKIVRTVSPKASIVVPKPELKDKKTQTASTQLPVDRSEWARHCEIPTPQFRGTALGR